MKNELKVKKREVGFLRVELILSIIHTSEMDFESSVRMRAEFIRSGKEAGEFSPSWDLI